jgi:beta-galactosidase/beta-glucuronidase
MSIRTFLRHRTTAGAVLSFLLAACTGFAVPTTEVQFLSGRGPADAVPWEFSVTAGRRAGEQAMLPVPSHWEFHGFGTYNYGQEQAKGSERGHYRTRFSVPAEWKGRRVRIVFGAVMTDTHVKVNGQSAGPGHQGGFTQFRYDVTRLLKVGAENVLEVEVAKVSANPDTERAERAGDYWVFGGVYRPVWLEAVPVHAIEQVAIDARADGRLTADVTLGTLPGLRRSDTPVAAERIDVQVLDAGGRPVGAVFTTRLPDGGAGRVRVAGQIASPRPWTAETPEL